MTESENTTTRVLAIRPGKKEMGVAVLRGGELAYWGVSGFRMTTKDDLVAAVATRVRNLVSVHRPSVLAIEAPLALRLASSPLLGAVVAQLEELAREAGLGFKAVKPTQLRECLCGSARATHAELTEHVVREYPHLGRYRNCGNAWKEAYWRPMFSAVAVALVRGAAAT